MAAGDLNDGSRFGLVPIGLPQAELSTPGSDTERRAFPGLSTKSSVFAWVTGFQQLMGRSGATGPTQSDVVNLRKNTATNGVSVDVPTWAAGCLVSFYMAAATAGTSTYFGWTMFAAPIGGTNPIFQGERNGRSLFADAVQVIVPFFDEPTYTVTWVTDGTGTATYATYLLGFVRNV